MYGVITASKSSTIHHTNYHLTSAVVVAAGQGQHQSDVPPGKVQLLLQVRL